MPRTKPNKNRIKGSGSFDDYDAYSDGYDDEQAEDINNINEGFRRFERDMRRIRNN